MNFYYGKSRKGNNQPHPCIYITVCYLYNHELFPGSHSAFLIAVIISSVNEPVISYMETKLRLNRKIASVISIIMTVSIIIILISLCIFKVYYELVKLNSNLPYYMESFSATASACYDRMSVFIIIFRRVWPIFWKTTLNHCYRNLRP